MLVDFGDQKVKLKAGKYMIPVTVERRGEKRLALKFGFNKPLLEEVRMMEGAKWHGHDETNPRKEWSVLDSRRNRFRLNYLAFPADNDPRNPYYPYNKPLIQYQSKRKPYAHQYDLTCGGLTRHYVLWGAEMGTGKTLAVIELMENCGAENCFYIAPKSALTSVKLELRKWHSRVSPSLMTYEALKKMLLDWPEGRKPPQLIVFDESSRLKNHMSQRTQGAQYIADAIRDYWDDKGFVIEMSGSPAPKSPVDWWSQCEVAQPGYIREGNPDKFRRRLAVMESRESFMGGGSYNHLVTWKDDENKCNVCGLPRDAETHSEGVDVFETTAMNHRFQPSVNEVSLLYRRMSGLVTVKFKKDCLDLPEKIYRIIRCSPTHSILNAARAIQAKSPTTIEALTLLRELSDGFQYVDQVSGSQTCPACKGTRVQQSPYDLDDPENDPTTEEFERGHRLDDEGNLGRPINIGFREEACGKCHGVGTVDSYTRHSEQVPCPKEGVLRDLLDEHDEVGRLVVYGGFTGTVDRVCGIVQDCDWKFIRLDGRGWFTDLPLSKDEAMIEAFQDKKGPYEKICFVGQPSSAGMGLTLTASPTVVYYSNDFNGESRIQSEDRIHRLGMDYNRGATIIDIFHLPSDELVYENLMKKKRLQDLSMGEMTVALNGIEVLPREY